ncbi:MAG: FAD binding domain-containing protein, partial [Betaproteobacteria bacterium]|nr:FAD binding domain-containing protein [Betaproteobacteria bacterium]
ALDALGKGGPSASILAGGQSLMPMLNMRVARPALVVDINRIGPLNRLQPGPDMLSVGALVRHADLLANAEIRRGWPLLAEATSMIGHPAIRNRGTVCGSVAHADPAAEHPGVLLAMDATVVIASASRRRELPAREFFVAMLTTALERGEMIVELRYPRLPAGTGTGYVEVARRHGAFAIAGVAAALTMRDGVCRSARISVVGVNDTAFRAEAAEAALRGKSIGAAEGARAFAAAAREVAAVVNPIDDVHASSSYRRHLAGVLTQRALEKALARAGGN